MNINDLLNNNALENIKDALQLIKQIQMSVLDYSSNEESGKSNGIKLGTTITIEMLNKFAQGVIPTEFTTKDWKDIAEHVTDKAFNGDGEGYSVYVFSLYNSYIRSFIQMLSGIIPNEKIEIIEELSDTLEQNIEDFQNGEIKEVDYIDENLWICLEAFVKLTAVTIGASAGKEKGQIIEATALFAFEYCRLAMLKKEQALLDEYLKNQKILDGELAVKYDNYSRELEAKTSKLESLIENAFAPDFKYSLKSSILFAREAGVSEEEILKTTEEVDEFFMN